MSSFFGNFKRPRAELKLIDKFIQIYEESRKLYKSKNYTKALSGFKIGLEILKDIYDIYPKVVVLYLIIKSKFKLNDYRDFELYIDKLDEYIVDLIKYKKDIFIKYKSKIFLYRLIFDFSLDNIEKSVNIVIQMIKYLKESNLLSLEEKVYFFWIYLKGFIKISGSIKTRKFVYFKEQYDSMLVEEIKDKRKFDEGIIIKQKKISRNFIKDYKSYMNSKMGQNIYENLDKKFYYFKYGVIDNKIMFFLNRNMELYLSTGNKDKLIEKFNNYLLVTKIDLKEKFNMSMNDLIQEQKRRLLGFHTIYSNIVGAFNHIFRSHFTEKEITFKQLSHSKSMEVIYGKKEIKEIEQKLIKHIRQIKPININSKKEKLMKLNSLTYKEINFPYNFKMEISIPQNIMNESQTIIKKPINKKVINNNKFGKFTFPKIKNKTVFNNNFFKKSKNEENKNIIPNIPNFTTKRLKKSVSNSLMDFSQTKISEILIKDRNKRKKELLSEKLIFRNINYFLITQLIEIFQNIFQAQEKNIKNDKNFTDKYLKLFPRKNDLFNCNILNSIKEYNTTSIKGTNSIKGNQDKYFFYEDFLLIKNFYLFGICDGHGKLGEEISTAVSYLFPSFINYILIEDNLNKRKQDINDMIINLFKLEESPKDIKEMFILRYIFDKFKIDYNYFPFISGNIKSLFHLLYESCYYIQKELVQRYHYDIEYSGTTLCSAFLLGKILYISNIGDSRIILGNYNPNLNKWTCKQLSLDHIPTSPNENKRILSNNGKVKKLRNEMGEEIGPYRVFEKDKDSMLPGLSMSRSIGDSMAKKLGVIFEPELLKYELNINDKIIIVGSDGFWIYINNEEAINLAGKYYEDGIKTEEASAKLVEIAKEKWIEENKKNPTLFTFNRFKQNNNDTKKNKKNVFIEPSADFQNYEQQKEKKYRYDDITCMIIYLEIK